MDSQVDRPATVTILGVTIACVDFAATLALIADWVTTADLPRHASAGRSTTRQICTVNPEFIMHARSDPAFARVLRQADLCVPDGVGVLWAARQQGVHLTERVTGSDGIFRICARAADAGWTVFLLGAAPGVAATAAAALQARYPTLKVVGTHGGAPTAAAWPMIREQLQVTAPHILFVAYGHPHQDRWIADHRDELPARVAIGVGGAFDFVAGVTIRAPGWMQRLGLEWLHRLITQPWRWRRMLVLPRFIWLVLQAEWKGETS